MHVRPRTPIPLPAFAALLALVLATLVPADEARAQGLRYTETTRMEMGGPMGAMMSMMGGMGDDDSETILVQGPRMRRDAEDRSTIVDWEAGDMVILDHEARTFMRMSWADMAEGMAVGMDRMEAARAEAEAAREDVPEGEWEVQFSTERTGRTEEISGYDAEQVIMVMRLVGEMPPEQQEESPVGEMGMAMVTELWLSTDFPGWTMMQESRDEMVQELWGDSEGMGPMGSLDPRFRVAMERRAEALEDLEGVPLRSVMSFVSLPPDVELDVEAVLETEELGGGGGLAGLAAAAAAGGARSRLGGLFGGGDDEEEETQPQQSVIMRTTTEIDDVDETNLDADVFAVPEGYTERAMPGMGGPGR